MADYKLTLAEKETIILWSEADDTVQIDTFSQKLINRLRKAKERCPEIYRVDEPDRYGGVHAEVPKKLLQISFREPISVERREQYARLAKERFHAED
ncbi:MAG: immunoglobulin [Clostridia bacterium]|nr:immunoglobulin [Clostridia bacterium]